MLGRSRGFECIPLSDTGMRPSERWGENLAMEIRRVRFSGPEVESLLLGLSDEYDTRYGENIEMTRASEAEFDPPAGLFIVFMDGPTTAAGGGFRRFDRSTCEVKRMWTSPLYRRRGLATRALQSLEKRCLGNRLRPSGLGDRPPPTGGQGSLRRSRILSNRVLRSLSRSSCLPRGSLLSLTSLGIPDRWEGVTLRHHGGRGMTASGHPVSGITGQ